MNQSAVPPATPRRLPQETMEVTGPHPDGATAENMREGP